MVSLEFDPADGALCLRLREGRTTESEPTSDNVIIDPES